MGSLRFWSLLTALGGILAVLYYRVIHPEPAATGITSLMTISVAALLSALAPSRAISTLLMGFCAGFAGLLGLLSVPLVVVLWPLVAIVVYGLSAARADWRFATAGALAAFPYLAVVDRVRELVETFVEIP